METETWAMGSPWWHSVKPLRPAVCTTEVLLLPGSQERLMHTGRHVCVRKNSPSFILVKAFLTEYGSQNTNFTVLNVKNVSIICKLNVQLRCLKCLDKKREAMKGLANVLSVTKLRILYFTSMEFFSCSISAADSRIGAWSLMWNNLHGFPTISYCSQLQGYNHNPSSTIGSRHCKPAAAKAFDSIQRRAMQLKTMETSVLLPYTF